MPDSPDPAAQCAVPVPSTRGREALEWLEAHGIAPLASGSVCIAASDYEPSLSDPFFYFLTKRLGLVSSFKEPSPAPNRGTWLHHRLESLASTPEAASIRMANMLKARLDGLRTVMDAWGLPSSDRDRVLESEEKDHSLACAWYDAASSIVIPAESLGRPMTFPQFLQQPSSRILGHEVVLVYHDPDYPTTPLVATLDILVLDTNSNQLWCVDCKTTRHSPRLRMASVGIEMQTLHYPYLISKLLPQLIEKFGLPPNVTVGGMIHLIIQKPTITFNPKVDRPFKWNQHILKSGPRKGQLEMRKEYLSEEPVYSLYVERCVRWMRGEGEYEDEAPQRQIDPPVNMSFSPMSAVLDADGLEDYHSRLHHIHTLATDLPYPNRFLRNPSYITQYEDLSVYAPFYMLPPAQWPEEIAKARLIQTSRYARITTETPAGVFTP